MSIDYEPVDRHALCTKMALNGRCFRESFKHKAQIP